MNKKDFYFHLPEKLIAQKPLEDRAAARLLVLDKKNGNMEHRIFSDILKYLNPGDCLVLNDTKVLPARLIGERINTGAKVEVLLLKRIDKDCWETLVRPGRKAKVGDKVIFGNGVLQAEILRIAEEGNRIVKFSYDGVFEEILDRLGQTPLPPYITEKLDDPNMYQTVYAKNDGSAAAPTAGLHFTPKLLEDIENMGVNIAYLTLHVGLGTFRPVKADNILEHKMHSEYYCLEKSQADIINKTKNENGKIIAVGTTSSRTLESIADENGAVKECSGWTDIFIYPGYKFKIVDALITNFHLPESTLIMLVSALAGRKNIIDAYNAAVENGYRFFSFGDAMFIK